MAPLELQATKDVADELDSVKAYRNASNLRPEQRLSAGMAGTQCVLSIWRVGNVYDPSIPFPDIVDFLA